MIWTTSSRSGFCGVRRKACCSGSFKCNNQDCTFLKFYQKENCLQFNATNNTCSVCGEVGAFINCDAIKIWEFDETRELVTVYHDGYHTCEAKIIFKMSDEVKDKINTEGSTVTKLSEDAIIDCLKEETPCWDDVYRVANSTLEHEKLQYEKQKGTSENYRHGHSLEAVAAFRTKLLAKDPFFIFRLNDRLMNGKPTFVFKMSRTQADLAIYMNCEEDGLLNGEYCFADGTFKRCPGFVTLSAFVYVGLLRRIVKICTMEAESESTENWIIFWNLLNQVLSEHKQTNTNFNPIGWCVDEAGGLWKALKVFFLNMIFKIAR